jgi:O-methyltransferase involved in polyketide biosynthesis
VRESFLACRYHLVAADFSDVTSLRTKLEESEVDYSCPTLVLAECALVYANADKVSEPSKITWSSQ